MSLFCFTATIDAKPLAHKLYFLLYKQQNLCHLSVAPYRTASQKVNDIPYTAPAKRSPKIGSRVYCEHVIFCGPLSRTDLKSDIQIAERQFMDRQVYSTLLDKQLIPDESWRARLQ